MDRTVLEKKALAELREIASTLELRGYQRMKKADLVSLIIDAATKAAANGGSGNGDAGEGAGDGDKRAGAGDTANVSETTGAGDSSKEGDGRGEREGRQSAGQASGATGNGSGGDAARVRARRRSAQEQATSGGQEADESRDEGRDAPRERAERSDRSQARDRGNQRDRSTRGGTSGDRDAAGGGRGSDQRGVGQADTDQAGGDQADTGQADTGQAGADQHAADQSSTDQSGADDGDANRNRNKRERRRKGRGPGQGQGQQEDLQDAEVREGVLDLLPEGYGFLRVTGYLSGDRDVYVSQSYVRRFDLRRGDRVAGPIRRNKNNDKFPALARVDTVEGEPLDLDAPSGRVEFKNLTPLFPTERLKLERPDAPMAMRLVDMMAPIGKGQRGLLVSPPKAGKTTVLKQLAAAIEANNPDVHLMVVLVDERPEEVTDFERSCKGEVISSTFDRPAEDHTQVAELAIERAKRLVERGRDVVILLDSITRLGRAYNLAAPASGRILSGGIDSAALYPPKRFFGAARNIEEGGSLTIVATALIETGSRMDEVIFEEFKGTGNMELRLDRRMEQKRIFPAIDIAASGTRREELLLPADRLETIWKLRRLLATMDSEAALQLLIDKLKATQSNEQFIQMIGRSNLQ